MKPRLLRLGALTLTTITVGCATTTYIRPDLAPPGVIGREPVDASRLLSRLVLVGDAGDGADEKRAAAEAVACSIAAVVRDEPELTTVVWLGDNVYPAGVPSGKPCATSREEDRERGEATRILARQVAATHGTNAKAFFVPGNHDWDQGKPCGRERVLAQQALVPTLAANARVMPEGACPGPRWLDLPGLRVVFLDSQWLLTSPELRTTAHCLHGTVDPTTAQGDAETWSHEVYTRLGDALAESQGRGDLSVVALHHPIYTGGPHDGGMYKFLPFWNPLNALANALRVAYGSSQDLAGPVNRAMVDELLEVFANRASPTFYAAGHDHSLQVFDDAGSTVYLVSGGGSKTTTAEPRRHHAYRSSRTGYMVIDVFAPIESGGKPRARLVVIDFDKKSRQPRIGLCAWKHAESGGLVSCEHAPHLSLESRDDCMAAN